MSHFDIVKKNDPDVTFRVSKIQADFDVKLEHSNERFVGDIEMPNDWQIGVIVGASGTGKSTIAKELFSEELINSFEKTTGVKLNYAIGERRQGDITQIWADTTVSEQELGWKAEMDIDQMTLSAWKWQQHLDKTPF